MKRYCSLFAAALLLAACLPLPAQGVQLDSLWGKIVGDVNAMTFSPDSKQLLIAGGDSWLRFFTADKGELLDSIAPQYGCRQLLYSHNGQLLFVAGVKGIHIFRAEDKSSVALIPLNLSEPSWFLSMDISPDDNYLAVKVMMPPEDVTLNDGYQRMMVFSYPEKQLLWQKDVPLWKASLKIALPKGKIAFSSDGNYILGHYNYSLARWDWRDSTKKEEILVSGLPDLDLIAFSPDRNYFVLTGREVWNISMKKRVTIEGVGTPIDKESAVFTLDGLFLVWNDDWFTKIVSITQQKTIYKNSRITGIIAISPDNLMLAHQAVRYTATLHKIQWSSTSVEDNSSAFKTQLQVYPTPGNDIMTIELRTTEKTKISVAIISDNGAELSTVYNGILEAGIYRFPYNTSALNSGNYFAYLQYGNSHISQPFIITK